MITTKDQLYRTLTLEQTPKRIVSLVPSLTELIVDLGLESALVGVTKFCVHPKQIRKEKVVVGGTKQVHFDKIKNLSPDFILCNKEENTLDMVRELEHIALVHVSDILDLDETIQVIEQYGQIFNVENRANLIKNEIKKRSEAFQHFAKQQPKLKVAYFIWQKPWMAVGSSTFINAMLELNNFKNVLANKDRYPQIELNDLKKMKPEVIMLSSEPFPFNKKHLEAMSQRFPESKIVIVDGEYFSWYGSRLIKAFTYFRNLRQHLLD